jgi:hypothetical protein
LNYSYFAALFALCVPFAHAEFVTFTGSQGDLAASAKFDFTGNTLTLTLTNTASTNSTQPGMLLSGVFFNVTGDPTLTPSTATVAPGSTIVQASNCTVNCVGVTNVGGEFAFNTGIAGRPQYGIAANGYINTSSGNFDGVNLHGPNAPNGPNFGIVTSNFNTGDGNGGMDNEPFIESSVVFELLGVAGLSVSNVTDVVFQYGASLTDANFSGTPGIIGGPLSPSRQAQVPEPSSLLLLGSMIAGTCHLVRKRRKA